MRSFCITAFTAFAGLAALLGCNDDRMYLGDGTVYQVALTQDTAPAFMTGMDAIYIVEKRVEAPVLRPTDGQLADLRKSASAFGKLPFSRLPWVGRGDLEMQVDFTLSNLDDSEHAITVILNGFNEFDEYQPGVQVADDQAIPDYAEWERLYKLTPKERLTHTIREEELDEAATDLATVVNGAPNANEVMYFENKSANDVRAKPYIPKIVPGLMGFRIGMRATGKGRVLLEATVRARDVGQRLADSGQKTFVVHPKLFTPMPPAEN